MVKEADGINSLVLVDEEITKSMKVELTRADLVSYKVSKEEDRLEAERDVLNGELKAVKETIGKLSENFKDAVEASGQEEAGAEVKALNTAMSKLGIKNRTFKVLTVIGDSKKQTLNISVSMVSENANRGYGYGNSAEFTEVIKTIAFNSKLKELDAKIDESTQESNGLVNKISEIRNRLANMGRLERKANAQIVEKMLGEKSKVREVLAAKK